MEAPPQLTMQSPHCKGFTLVEIMIVVVIIGLLAAMAFPAFSRIRTASQDKAVLNNARQLASASDQYMAEFSVPSVTFDEIVGPTGYIKSIPLVAGETYPAIYTQGTPIVVTNIGGDRTVSFQR